MNPPIHLRNTLNLNHISKNNVINYMYKIIIVLFLTSCTYRNTQESICSFKTANSLYIKGNTSEALLLLKNMEKKDPCFLPALFLSGKIHYMNKNLKKAEDKWKKVLNINPHHIQTGKWLCSMYMIEKKYKEAEKLLFLMFENSANDPELLILAGRLRKNEGKYLEALEYYNKAFLFEDKIIEAHLDTSEIYTLFGIREKSLIHLKKAASVGGDNHELYKPINSIINKTSAEQ
jgi:tetratricopeptide (TPR) repeat protein